MVKLFYPSIHMLAGSVPEFATVHSVGYEKRKYYAWYGLDDNMIKFEIHNDVSSMEYFHVKKLLEWHFDVFGLIESGLAIDVTTLETNPYEH